MIYISVFSLSSVFSFDSFSLFPFSFFLCIHSLLRYFLLSFLYHLYISHAPSRSTTAICQGLPFLSIKKQHTYSLLRTDNWAPKKKRKKKRKELEVIEVVSKKVWKTAEDVEVWTPSNVPSLNRAHNDHRLLIILFHSQGFPALLFRFFSRFLHVYAAETENKCTPCINKHGLEDESLIDV